jgi:hypothetical protein
MLAGPLFALVVLSVGYATLRVLGLAKGAAALGIVPAAGLATAVLGSTWVGIWGIARPAPGALVLLCSLAGIGLAVADRDWLWRAIDGFVREHRLSAALLAAAILVPLVSIGIAFAGVQAPLSPHDGAFHVETTDAFRHGLARVTWYPPGLAALFGAVLQLVPWVDTAAGTYQLGVTLSLLAPLAMFGLGAVVWRNLVVASVGALLVSLTYLFPYYAQIWAGWPQLLGMLLVIGLWILAIQYVDRPSWRLAGLAGLFVGAIVVVHGTELYSSSIVLVVLALANWQRLPWKRLGVHVGGAVVLALVCAAPYLPVLLQWAGTGGAFDVGFDDGGALATGARSTTAADLLGVFTLDALGVDLPVRVLLLALGLVWAVRQPGGRALVATGGVFVGLAVASSFLNGLPIFRQIYAVTYPWGLPFRLLMFATIPITLVAAGGSVWLASAWSAAVGRIQGPVIRRRAQRLGRLLVVTWLLLATAALVSFLSIPRGLLSSFSNDDAAAMAWLRVNAEPGALLANDTFADAGIWAPYKAGVPILVYRSTSDPATSAERQLVLSSVGRLDQDPEAAAAACTLNVDYVYHGAQNSAWQERQFPTIAQLSASPLLEEVFSSGDAAVFRLRLGC